MSESSFARPKLLWTIAVVAMFFMGCSETARRGGAAMHSDPASATQNVDVRNVDRDKYDAIIGEQRGKVVLVDFWATWCLPCVAQLPHTIELADRFRERGLVVVTVSLDQPAEADRVAEFLREKQGSALVNLISQYGVGPESIAAFEIASGAVPHYKLYDRAGRLRHRFELNPGADQQFTPQEIEAAVEQLLAE